MALSVEEAASLHSERSRITRRRFLLLIGMIWEWRQRSPFVRPLAYITAALAAASMILAALMGHLANWIMEFGSNFPPLISAYEKFAGFASSDDFTGALVGSHSHEMAVAAMALTVVLLAQQFGSHIRMGVRRILVTTGLVMVAAGTVIVTAMYLAAAFTTWSPPAWFVSGPGGANGIASDDVISGILILGGGVLVAAALVVGRSLFHRPVRLAAAWAWVLSFATVVVAGYAIEMNEVYFGPGYIISTVGLIVVGVALLATLWWGVLGAKEQTRHIPQIPSTAEPVPMEAEKEPVSV